MPDKRPIIPAITTYTAWEWGKIPVGMAVAPEGFDYPPDTFLICSFRDDQSRMPPTPPDHDVDDNCAMCRIEIVRRASAPQHPNLKFVCEECAREEMEGS